MMAIETGSAPTYTYEVTFYTQDKTDAHRSRVESENIAKALTQAAVNAGVDKLTKYCGMTQIEVVDAAAELAHAEQYKDLYEVRDATRRMFEEAGFIRAVGTVWNKHNATGLVAFVDEPDAPEGSRIAGIFMHTVDPDTGKDKMTPWLTIPWYGDGAWREKGETLLRVALAAATQTEE